MKVSRCSLPSISAFKSYPKTDYLDCFETTFNDPKNNVTTVTAGKNFFTSAPKWIENLFELREKIAGLIGLKTGEKKADRQKALDSFECEVGQQLGLFKVHAKSQEEVIIGQDDSHLNFRVSVVVKETAEHQKTLTLSTHVVFNNWVGKLYFFPVKPFHKLIVPVMMKGMVNGLLN
jgi:hypothetical protein